MRSQPPELNRAQHCPPRTALRVCVCAASILATSCGTTQLRWDAVGMRQQLIKYYDDEIMENLIMADQRLPFIHVDIKGLTTIDTTQLTGSIGAGETPSFTRTSRSGLTAITGAIPTIVRGVTRPFSYSVSPQRGNSLQFTAAPVLGPVAIDPGTTTISSKKFVPTKITEERPSPSATPSKVTTEKSPPPGKTTTIYALYESFVQKNKGTAFRSVEGLFPPEQTVYVPGTLKRWGNKYYYIDNNYRETYYRFCKMLLTKTQAQGAAELQQVETELQGVKGLQAIPPPPPSPQ